MPLSSNPNETWMYPKCLPRPQRCQCLGDFKLRNYSINALDMFCRNDSLHNEIMESIHRDDDQNKIPVINPSKVRCGSEDPLEMNITNKCHCWPTAGEGASKPESRLIYHFPNFLTLNFKIPSIFLYFSCCVWG